MLPQQRSCALRIFIEAEQSLIAPAAAVLQELFSGSNANVEYWPVNGLGIDDFAVLRTERVMLFCIPPTQNLPTVLPVLRVGARIWQIRNRESLASMLSTLAPGWRVYGGTWDLFKAIRGESHGITAELARLMHELVYVDSIQTRRALYDTVLRNIDPSLFVPFNLCNDFVFCDKWRNSVTVRRICRPLLAETCPNDGPEALWVALCCTYKRYLEQNGTLDAMKRELSILLQPWCEVGTG
jgi:hypothetical protein